MVLLTSMFVVSDLSACSVTVMVTMTHARHAGRTLLHEISLTKAKEQYCLKYLRHFEQQTECP